MKKMNAKMKKMLPIPTMPTSVGVGGNAMKAAGEHAKAAGMFRKAAAKAKSRGDYTAAAEHHRMAAESHMRAEQAKQKPYPKSALSMASGHDDVRIRQCRIQKYGLG